MAHGAAYGDSHSYWKTQMGADVIDLGKARIVETPKLESPETVANRERVTKNLMGKA